MAALYLVKLLYADWIPKIDALKIVDFSLLRSYRTACKQFQAILQSLHFDQFTNRVTAFTILTGNINEVSFYSLRFAPGFNKRVADRVIVRTKLHSQVFQQIRTLMEVARVSCILQNADQSCEPTMQWTNVYKKNPIPECINIDILSENIDYTEEYI